MQSIAQTHRHTETHTESNHLLTEFAITGQQINLLSMKYTEL